MGHYGDYREQDAKQLEEIRLERKSELFSEIPHDQQAIVKEWEENIGQYKELFTYIGFVAGEHAETTLRFGLLAAKLENK